MPWLLAQAADDLLMWHHPVEPDALAALLPHGLVPDVDDHGSAWVTVLAMRMAGVRVRLLPPVPGLSSYPQVALRAFVRAGGQSGVTFLSLEAPGRLVTWLSRYLLHLPARRAHIVVRDHTVLSDSLEATWDVNGSRAPDDFLGERDALLYVSRGRVRCRMVRHVPVNFLPATVVARRETLLARAGLTAAGPAVTRACDRLASHVWLPSTDLSHESR